MLSTSALVWVSLIFVVILGLFLKKMLKQKSLLELLVFSIFLILTGGVIILDQNISNRDPINIVGYVLIYIGFFSGVLSFVFKRNE